MSEINADNKEMQAIGEAAEEVLEKIIEQQSSVRALIRLARNGRKIKRDYRQEILTCLQYLKAIDSYRHMHFMIGGDAIGTRRAWHELIKEGKIVRAITKGWTFPDSDLALPSDMQQLGANLKATPRKKWWSSQQAAMAEMLARRQQQDQKSAIDAGNGSADTSYKNPNLSQKDAAWNALRDDRDDDKETP